MRNGRWRVYAEYPTTIESICIRCHHRFTATRTRVFDRDGYPIYRKQCPDCIHKEISTRRENYGTIAPGKTYDDRLRDGFAMLNQDDT
jgi:NAD-dependent SIR2 family protein deacetylase